HTAAAIAGCPMEHMKSSEVPANADESDVVVQPMRLATPKDHRGIVMLHPFPVSFVQVDRDAAKCVAPLDHAGVVMRVGNRNGGQAAECLHKLNRVGVNQAEAVP